MEKDIIIIGGGPGGYVAAIRASQLGAKVVLIEANKIGGTCLNWGCIPTKALYKYGQILQTLKKSEDFGIQIDGFSLDMKKAQERKNDLVSRLASGISHLLKEYQVEVLYGKASLVDKSTAAVTDADGSINRVKAKNILIATGSIPSTIPIEGLDLPGVINSAQALDLDYVPKTMVIIGAGVVGVEFASIYQALGTQVTLVEYLPSILANFDEEIVKRAAFYYKKCGIKIETGVKIEKIVHTEEGLKVLAQEKTQAQAKAEDQEKTEAQEKAEGQEKAQDQEKANDQGYQGDLVLVAAGRSINVEGLNLDQVGVAYHKKGIEVNDGYETSVSGIYAIGDVIGGQMLAHVASEEGKAAVEYILGHKGYVNYDAVPSCVFTFPEIATCGLTEEEAKKRGISYEVSKSMFSGNGKALTMGESDGFVKIIAEKSSKKIIGVHIIGPNASDLIHEGALAVENALSVTAVGQTIHAHPSLAETFHEAVLAIDHKGIHTMPKK